MTNHFSPCPCARPSDYRRRVAESSAFRSRKISSEEGLGKYFRTPESPLSPARDSRRDTEQPQHPQRDVKSEKITFLPMLREKGCGGGGKKVGALDSSEVTVQALAEARRTFSAVLPIGNAGNAGRENKRHDKGDKRRQGPRVGQTENRRGGQKEEEEHIGESEDLAGLAEYLADDFFRSCMADCYGFGERDA